MDEDLNPPIHGSAFSYHGMGCLILGASGTGKSHLLAEAMLHGAHMIADDCVKLCTANGKLVARAGKGLCGVLELRGFGLIRKPATAESHPIHLVIELDPNANERLPDPHTIELMGVRVPHLKLKPPPATSVAALLLYLHAMQEGRILPTDWSPKTC